MFIKRNLAPDRSPTLQVAGVEVLVGYGRMDTFHAAVADDSPGGEALLEAFREKIMARYHPNGYATRRIETSKEGGKVGHLYTRYNSTGD